MPNRYFVSKSGFKDGTAYLRYCEEMREGEIVSKDGETTPVNVGGLVRALDFVIEGSWKEVTEKEAKALVTPPKPKIPAVIGGLYRNEYGDYTLVQGWSQKGGPVDAYLIRNVSGSGVWTLPFSTLAEAAVCLNEGDDYPFTYLGKLSELLPKSL